MSCVVCGCYVVTIYTEHSRYGLSCMNAETVECMHELGLYGMLE